MTKEELKEIIKQLKLESDLEGIVLELIDNAKEVTAELLNGIADILDLQAEFYEKAADILEEEARAYDKLNVQIDNIEDDISNDRVQAISEAQEQLLQDIAEKIENIRANQSPMEPPATADAASTDTTQPAGATA
jgi:hypothetical protein